MAGIEVKVHPVANFSFKPIAQLVGVLGIEVEADADGNGQKVQPKGLAFTDPDGETHVYVFTDEGRRNLIGQLTGGVMLPT